MRERDIENYLRDEVASLGGVALKFTSPGYVGVPDRMVLLPGGKVFFVELKAPHGRLTERQIRTHAKFRELGFTVAVCYSCADVDALLKRCFP